MSNEGWNVNVFGNQTQQITTNVAAAKIIPQQSTLLVNMFIMNFCDFSYKLRCVIF